MESVARRPEPVFLIYISGLLFVLAAAAAGVLFGWKIFALATCGLVGTVVLIRFGRILWSALIVLVAFSIEISLPGASAQVVVPTELLIPALTAAALLDLFVKGKFAWYHNRLNLSVALFFCVLVLSIFFSTNRIVTLKAVIRDGSYILAGYLLIRHFLTTQKQLISLLVARAIVTTVLVVYGMYTQFTQGLRIYQVIAAPFYEQYSVYAALVTFDFAVLCAFVIEYPRSSLRWIGFVLLGLWGFAIAITFSRGAWLSIVAMGGFYLFLRRRQIDLKIALAAGMLVILGVMLIGWLQLSYLFSERFEHLTDWRFLTNYDRIDRWMAALSIFSDHPIIGVGWGRYADEYFNYIWYTDAYSTDIRMGAHNLYLEILAEIGLAGIVSFALLVLFFFIEAVQCLRKSQDRFFRALTIGLMGAMLTYLVHAFVNNLGPSDKIGLSVWVVIGLVPVIGHFLSVKSEGETTCQDACAGHR